MNSVLRFEIKSKALSDMEDIFDYIAKDNKEAALDLLDQFYKVFNLICTLPEVGKKAFGFYDEAVRLYIVNKKYLVVYKQENEIIDILRILSSYQDICAYLK